jgi:hypothetical protein
VWPLWGYHVPAFDGEEPPDYTQIDNRVNETVCVLDNSDLYERIVPEGVTYHPPTPKTLGEQWSEMSNVWDRRIEPPDPRPYRIDLQAIRRFFEANSTLGRPPLIFKEEREGLPTEQAETAVLTENVRETLLRQIGILAILLSEKSGKYKRGSKPNASNIAEDVGVLIDFMGDVNKLGLADTLRKNISEGIKLLNK